MRWSCVGSRPAVSASTTSMPRARAAAIASKITAAGSPPACATTVDAVALCPRRQAARAPPRETCRPRRAAPRGLAPGSSCVSLPMVVVLPAPFTPASMITKGFCVVASKVLSSGATSAAISSASSALSACGVLQALVALHARAKPLEAGAASQRARRRPRSGRFELLEERLVDLGSRRRRRRAAIAVFLRPRREAGDPRGLLGSVDGLHAEGEHEVSARWAAKTGLRSAANSSRAPLVRPRTRTPRTPTARRNRVRIIAGEWRSRIVTFPGGSRACGPRRIACARPCSTGSARTSTARGASTSSPGSGALGFEALSRGASRVVMVERYARRRGGAARERGARSTHADSSSSTAMRYTSSPRRTRGTVRRRVRRSALRERTHRRGPAPARGRARRAARASTSRAMRRSWRIDPGACASTVAPEPCTISSWRWETMTIKAVYPGTFDPHHARTRGPRPARRARCSTRWSWASPTAGQASVLLARRARADGARSARGLPNVTVLGFRRSAARLRARARRRA